MWIKYRWFGFQVDVLRHPPVRVEAVPPPVPDALAPVAAPAAPPQPRWRRVVQRVAHSLTEG